MNWVLLLLLNDKFFRYTAKLCLCVTVLREGRVRENAQWGTGIAKHQQTWVQLSSTGDCYLLVVLLFQVPFPFNSNCRKTVCMCPCLLMKGVIALFNGTEQWDDQLESPLLEKLWRYREIHSQIRVCLTNLWGTCCGVFIANYYSSQ